MKSLIFAAVLVLGSVVLAASAGDYFSGMDQVISTHAPASRLQGERYILLMARLSVFAIYCDSNNSIGLNTKVYQLRQRTTRLQKNAEVALGGTTEAYNRFEDERNDESLRFVSMDKDQTCADNASVFNAYVRRSANELDKLFRNSAYGQL